MSHLPNPPDFPIEINITGFQNTLAYGFAQRFNIRGAGITVIDKKIAMQFGNLRVADAQAPASCGIDQFPGFRSVGIGPTRIFKRAAARARFNRLARPALVGNLVHLRCDGVGIGWNSTENRRRVDNRIRVVVCAVAEIKCVRRQFAFFAVQIKGFNRTSTSAVSRP